MQVRREMQSLTVAAAVATATDGDVYRTNGEDEDTAFVRATLGGDDRCPVRPRLRRLAVRAIRQVRVHVSAARTRVTPAFR